MKYFTLLLVVFVTLSISTSGSAQFKLKKLDKVVVSMSQGESIDKYTKYLAGYFERIELTETISSKSNFTIVEADSRKFLQGDGINAEEQKVVFRIEVSISADGLTITQIENEFTAQVCASAGCVGCAFNGAISCACEGEGECNRSVSLETK